MFGQIPDTLEDVWVHVALYDEERARQLIADLPPAPPLAVKYDSPVRHVDWETCARVLIGVAQLEELTRGW